MMAELRKKQLFRYYNLSFKAGAVAVAQLAEWSLPIPEDPGSKPAIGNFY